MCFGVMEDFILRGPAELASWVFEICSKMQAILPRTSIRLDKTVIELVDRCLEAGEGSSNTHIPVLFLMELVPFAAAQRSRPMEDRTVSR